MNMEIHVWVPVLTVATAVYFVYRGWEYEESLTPGGSAYATARAESRDGDRDGPGPVPGDEIQCRNCGTRNEPAFRFCQFCTLPLPERRPTAQYD